VLFYHGLQSCLKLAKGIESHIGSQLDSLSVFEQRYESLLELLQDCPESLIVNEEMPVEEALKQHVRFFNQDLPEAVAGLKEVADQLSSPDAQTQSRLQQVRY